MKVRKRDGRLVEFDIKRIERAIGKAMKEEDVYDLNLISSITFEIFDDILDGHNLIEDIIDVETIQDFVENRLMLSGHTKVAKSYILYRNKRDMARSAKVIELFSEIVNAKANDVTRENANMNADTPAGMMMKFAGETTKDFTKMTSLSDETVKAMNDNKVYPHDLDYYPTKSTTCVHHPVNNVTGKGFRAGHGSSRPAKRIETASILGCISLETAQNEQHGGQSIPAFDFYLAPYVRTTFEEELDKIAKLEKLPDEFLTGLKNYYPMDYLIKPLGDMEGTGRILQHAVNETVGRVHQAMEAFIHNMNTIHSRGGNQVVFSSINYGTDTSAEGRCIIREVLNSTYQGVGDGETAIFPIQIWKKKRGVSYLPTDPNFDLYKLACKVTARRFFPTFLNLDATFNQNPKWDAQDPERYKYELATMGCRTRVYEDRFGETTCIGRGNLSFSTINIVGIALDAIKDTSDETVAINKFFAILDEYLEITARQLYDRYKFQATAVAKQFPLLMSSLWMGGDKLGPNDSVGEVLKHGSLAIGFIGLAECLTALIGEHHGESDRAQELGLKIVGHMRKRCDEFSETYDMNYGVIGTPAEGLSGKFVKKDKVKYGIIKGVTDKEYYTNSNHIPVYYNCSASHKARIEGPYHALENGGHIFYVELDGDATHNVDAVMSVVDLMDKYNVGYGATNINRNRCMDCGFENAQKELTVCPKCGGTHIDTIQRITGYLVGTLDRWNSAKLAEVKDRVPHEV